MPVPWHVDRPPALRVRCDAAGRFGPGAYADWRATSLGGVTEALEQSLILRLAGAVDGRAVLDVGCGDGALASLFWQKGASSVIGCDPDAQMIARARTRAAEQNAAIGYAIADAAHLPFRTENFDIVTIVTVLAFVRQPERTLREIMRVLKPGGRLIIGDLGRWSLWAASRRIRGWLRLAPVWSAARFRTATELRRLAEFAGLRVEHISGSVYYPRCRSIARLAAPIDPVLGELTTFGAAFVAVLATKACPGRARS
jgi:ubiquinone/menaquinone biosynthesis C-methylase UbiE